MRYNFAAGVIDGVGWPLGMAFFSTSTIVEAFLLRLHATNVVIGAMPALISLGYFMPGLLVARKIGRLRLVRPWLFCVGVCERIPLLLIPLLVACLGVSRPRLVLELFFVLIGIHAVMLGMNQPSYWALIGKLIPTRSRGRMFGIAGLIGGIAGLFVDPTTQLAFSRSRPGSLDGFAWCFLVGATIVAISFLPFAWLREEPAALQPVADDPHAGRYLQDALRIIRGDSAFRLFLLSSVPFSFCVAASIYYLAASTHRFHPGAAEVALYTTILVVSGAFGNIVWGWWADRSGNKVVLLAATLLGAMGTGLAIGVQSATGFGAVFCLSALGAAGFGLASFNIVLEFAPDERDIPLYMAVYNGFTGPFKAFSPLCFGWLADLVGFNPVFISATVLGVVSLLLVLPVVEPRRFVAVAVDEPI